MTTETLILSIILFTIGAVGFMVRRNAIVMLMSLEIMLNACNLLFIAFAQQHGNMAGHIWAIMVMVVAAAEAAVGLAIVVMIFRTRKEINLDKIDLMKG